MIRVSATNLEAYRRFLVSEEMELEQIRDYLLRKTPPSPAMKAGTAFHKLLENAAVGNLDTAEVDGFRFAFNIDAEVALPDTRELKIEKLITVNGDDVALVGVVDAIHGKTIFDHKLTAKEDVTEYTDSFQWRCYLDWFNADEFIYNLFIKGYQPVDSDPNEITIKAFTQVSFNRYPSIHDDVMDMVDEYVDFIKKFIPEMVK